ncbi:alpha/beta fold hydrolase [Rubrivirga marina]|uniref:AB hydrolase-1 domain-containing protein n=1 Tax=Rubrivirga marina TaxID=1196024 RepID=A0A271J5E0_9BACT|nr:alpha/beta fold hydrolase [Rubrivirga marina]PAP78284.1 hypothetical protein BSZ37_18565 [Rubrivirga marina]
MPLRLPLLAVALVFLGGCGGLKESLVERGIADRRAEAGLETREVVVSERPVAYLERPGAEPALVLVHGFGASKDAWLAFARAYPEGRRLLAPDLAGHGGSVRDSSVAYDADRLADEVGAWLDAVAPGDVHVAGNSLGGAVAARLALAGPDRVRRLVLIDAAGVRGPEPTALDSALARGEVPLIPTTRAEYDRFLALAFEGDPGIPGPARDVLAADVARRAPFLRDLFRQIATESDAIRPRLGEIEQPTLVIWGAEDRILSPSAVPLWEDGLPDATTAVLPGVGHAPMQERPAETARLVTDFLPADG